MSDDLPLSAHPGTISPRNVDTVHYRVLAKLPKDIAPVGGRFSAWPQGEVFACVSGIGLGPVKNSDIADWLEAGLIERETPLTPAQERARMTEALAAATPVAEIASEASSATGSRPWTLPGAIAAGGKG
jgi:hypothetical protein